MALRLVEIYLPDGFDGLERLEEAFEVVGQWEIQLAGGQRLVRVLVHAEETEHYLDLLGKALRTTEAYRIVLLPVEAVLPRVEADAEEAPQQADNRQGRISREELYQDVS